MNILILSFYFQPDLSAGSFRTAALTNELKKDLTPDDQVDIITTMPNRYSSYSQDAKEYESDQYVSIYRIPLGTHASGFLDQSILFARFAWEVYKIIRKKNQYDIIYATSSRLMTAFLGAIFARKLKSKLYLDMRDIFTDTLRSIFQNRKIRFILPLFDNIEKFTINSAHHINLVSKGFKDYFSNINNNITYSFYPNGIDNVFLNYDFKNDKDNNIKRIVYAGNIGEGQGLEKIIPQMAKYLGNQYEIHIIGDGGTKNKLAESTSGINNVFLHNPVKRKELCLWYKKSDFLFLHLNSYEAFKKVLPSKLFEYAATNKYIIAGVEGYAAEFIKEHLTSYILFSPCNIDEFKQKFENLDQNKPVNRKDFISEFSRSNIMEKMAKEVYKL